MTCKALMHCFYTETTIWDITAAGSKPAMENRVQKINQNTD